MSVACFGLWLIFSGLLLNIQTCGKPLFNPVGPEYVGKYGKINFSIFASVAATHSVARDLCSLYYTNGRLAWLGDLKDPTMASLAEKATMYNYMNMNHFFWIDGVLEDSKCLPKNETCGWIPERRSMKYVTHIPAGVSVRFTTSHAACEKKQNSGHPSVYRPVLMPNQMNELSEVDADYVLATAAANEETGFICSYPSNAQFECPFGYNKAEKTTVPPDLVPLPVFQQHACP